jgi:hypothetical protein
MRIGLILAALLSAAASKREPSPPAAVPRAPIEVACALRERRSVADFDLHQPAFCETHGRELRAALAGR